MMSYLAAIVAMLGGVVLVSHGLTAALSRMHVQIGNARTVVGSTVLVLFALWICGTVIARPVVLLIRRVPIEAAIAALVCLVGLSCLVGFRVFDAPSLSTVTYAAVTEDFVFRALIPASILGFRKGKAAGRISWRDAIVAFVLPQVAFAAAHPGPIWGGPDSLLQLNRLFVLGVLLAGVTVVAGWGVAAGLHAVLNLQLQASSVSSLSLVSYPTLFLACAFAAIVIGAMGRPRARSIWTLAEKSHVNTGGQHVWS